MTRRPVSFHPELLPPDQIELLRLLSPGARAEGFYLAGGTALAIQLGHRRSIDLDWFREEPIPDPLELARVLESAELPVQVERTARDTLHARIRDVTVSFLTYRYKLLEPLVEWTELDCQLASLEDIAASKLAAVAQRGARKDFFDVSALGEAGFDLATMLDLYRRRFGIEDVEHVLAALVYFDDAERDPEPILEAREEWDGVKARIRAWVKEYAG